MTMTTTVKSLRILIACHTSNKIGLIDSSKPPHQTKEENRLHSDRLTSLMHERKKPSQTRGAEPHPEAGGVYPQPPITATTFAMRCAYAALLPLILRALAPDIGDMIRCAQASTAPSHKHLH